MWLVLCDSTDAPARWAHEGLRRRGLEPVELVTSDDLAHARWDYRVGERGVRVDVALRDARVLRNKAIRGTLNRLLRPPQGDMLLIQPSDREYVFQEQMAVFMSWLGALAEPVLNTPAPECLAGRTRSLAEWFWLAGKAGLPTYRVRVSSHESQAAPSMHVRIPGLRRPVTTLFVVGDRIAGAPEAPAAIVEGCRRLAALAQTPLLSVEFTVGCCGEGWKLAGVSGMPDLREGGDALLDALVAVMRS
jgi:hypothetical protein